MKRGKLFLVLLVSIVFSIKSNAQYYFYDDGYYDNDVVFEYGLSIGTMNCITDVGGANSDSKYYINEIRGSGYKLSGGVYVGMMYQNFVGVRFEGTWGSVKANDKDITSTSTLNLITKNNRNLNFKSKINEIALMVEFHPWLLKYYDDGPPRLSPYALAGVGYTWFYPRTEVGGRTIDLQPLHTEGQGFDEYPDRTPYKTSTVVIPVGMGLRYELSPVVNLRLEYIHRVMFTDYLDDSHERYYPNPDLFAKYLAPREAAYAKALSNPSTNGKVPARRGNPDDNDTYMSLNFKVGILLGRQNRYN